MSAACILAPAVAGAVCANRQCIARCTGPLCRHAVSKHACVAEAMRRESKLLTVNGDGDSSDDDSQGKGKRRKTAAKPRAKSKATSDVPDKKVSNVKTKASPAEAIMQQVSKHRLLLKTLITKLENSPGMQHAASMVSSLKDLVVKFDDLATDVENLAVTGGTDFSQWETNCTELITGAKEEMAFAENRLKKMNVGAAS